MKPHILRLYLRELGKRKKKTSLITFAISWGALSLLLLMSFGRGLSDTFSASFKGLGDNLMIISGGQTSKVFQGLPKGRRIRLYPEDITLLRDLVPEIDIITPESFTRFVLRNGESEASRNVNGVYPSFGILRNQIARDGGRFLNPLDEEKSRRVVFLGWNVAEELFKGKPAEGKQITIRRVPFTVVGVMKKKLQSSSYEGMDADQVYIPFSTFSQIYSQKFLDRIHIRPVSKKSTRYVEQRLRFILGKKYRFDTEDEFSLNIWNTIEQAKVAGKVFTGIEMFLGLIGGLTLLIGAVGVTNLMYAIVKERTREIGIKMALGARRRHIVQQFLLEALMIFFKGTMWGGLLAFNIVSLVRSIPVSYGMSSISGYLLRPRFSFDILMVFIVIMGVLIFVSGIFPALRASRLNPVEALRYE